jgi:diguanylate cyclase (GGDEF)-like protein|tara:strand:- start:2777 stop:4525 length:1749 start_codon:yes stop_codon:yes gene_type:complete
MAFSDLADDVVEILRLVDPAESEQIPMSADELLDADGSLLIVLNQDGSIRTVNPLALSVLGATTIADFEPDGAPAAMLRSLLDHVPQRLLGGTDRGTWHGDFDYTNADGEFQIYRATVTVRSEAMGGEIAIIAHDVTTARNETARLHHRATHDPLTGLANRRQVMAVLREAVAAQRDKPGHVATLFIDLDRLKYVNDALGHQVGDRLLTSTAARLAEAVRPNDHVARIGGDEFLVVCSQMPDAITALDLAERVRGALSGKLRVKELDLEFSVSLGIALTDAHVLQESDEDAASLLINNSDTAMYEAKRTGRGRSVLFTSQMRSAARERTELATALAHAIARNELTIEYQPVFSAVTQRATGAEALVRWQHPTRGWIDPATFVSVAEESGSIGRLGDFVLREAVGGLRHWLDANLVDDTFAVHVNVSHLQLASRSFVPHALGILRTHRIDPSQLVFEARESALGGSNADVPRTVRSLRRAGVRVAIDNFGTGANALSVLTDVGADILKLDGSLALPSGSSEADVRLVRAVVLLAHALDMRVVAERVSGADQLKRLCAAGCDYVQGNLLAPPTPAARFDPSHFQ